jgi:hypothetical protein
MRIDRDQLAIIFSHRERHEEPHRPEALASLRPMRPPGRDRDRERVRAKKKSRHRSPGRAKFKIEHGEGADLFKETGKWNKLMQVIDPEAMSTRNLSSTAKLVRSFDTSRSRSTNTVVMVVRRRVVALPQRIDAPMLRDSGREARGPEATGGFRSEHGRQDSASPPKDPPSLLFIASHNILCILMLRHVGRVSIGWAGGEADLRHRALENEIAHGRALCLWLN